MKKALLFSMFALLLTACTGYSNEKSVIENGVEYNISDNHKEAMAESYQWNAKEDNVVITIPDTISDGTPVVSMGGLTGIGVPLHFHHKHRQECFRHRTAYIRLQHFGRDLQRRYHTARRQHPCLPSDTVF